MKPMDIIFIGACIVALGAFVAAYGTRIQNKASAEKTAKQISLIEKQGYQILDLGRQNFKLTENVADLLNQNNELTEQVIGAKDELVKVRSEAIDNTFGSKNLIFRTGDNYGMLYNESELPAYEVAVFTTNYDNLIGCEFKNDARGILSVASACYNNNTIITKFPIIYGHAIMDMPEIKVNNKARFRILTKFITKKATYYQQSLFDPRFGLARRILVEKNIDKFYSQFNQDGLTLPFMSNEEIGIRIISETNLGGHSVDWGKEFPLPLTLGILL